MTTDAPFLYRTLGVRPLTSDTVYGVSLLLPSPVIAFQLHIAAYGDIPNTPRTVERTRAIRGGVTRETSK
jgi:hypothetical protein